MDLSRRLLSVGLQLAGYQRVADIGADHGYLSVWLVNKGRADFVVAGEKPAGPLLALRMSVRAAGLEERVEVRGGDGLQVLQPGEVEACAIAGLGGGTIAGILSRSPAVVAKLSGVVCQPMTDSTLLRRWFYENSWHLKYEDLVSEDGRIYEVLHARPGWAPMPEPVLLDIGPLLWRDRHPLLKAHLRTVMQHMEPVLEALQQGRTEVAAAKREVYEKQYREMEMRWRCL